MGAEEASLGLPPYNLPKSQTRQHSLEVTCPQTSAKHFVAQMERPRYPVTLLRPSALRPGFGT
jgi:hypothetical protein